MNTQKSPDKSLVSVCGLFCQACGIYWSTQENNVENLERIAKRINVPFDEIRCNGCRSETRTAYCKNCFMQKCAAEKGYDVNCRKCGHTPGSQFVSNNLDKIRASFPARHE